MAITLKHPVKLPSGETLSELNLRRPTVGDCIKAKINPGTQDAEGEARLLARLCGLVIEDFYLLDMEDYLRLQTELLSFLGGTSETE